MLLTRDIGRGMPRPYRMCRSVGVALRDAGEACLTPGECAGQWVLHYGTSGEACLTPGECTGQWVLHYGTRARHASPLQNVQVSGCCITGRGRGMPRPWRMRRSVGVVLRDIGRGMPHPYRMRRSVGVALRDAARHASPLQKRRSVGVA